MLDGLSTEDMRDFFAITDLPDMNKARIYNRLIDVLKVDKNLRSLHNLAVDVRSCGNTYVDLQGYGDFTTVDLHIRVDSEYLFSKIQDLIYEQLESKYTIRSAVNEAVELADNVSGLLGREADEKLRRVRRLLRYLKRNLKEN